MSKGSILLFCIALLLSFCSNKKNVTWKDTIGTICDRSDGKKASWMCYKVAGNEYRERLDGWYVNTLIGEKYVIHYNANKPREIKIDVWHPVFEENESTSYVSGQVVTVQKHSSFVQVATVTYKYRANREMHEKYIELPDNYQQLYTNLQEGQFYNVQIWNENINRAVLRLDLPIRDTANMSFNDD